MSKFLIIFLSIYTTMHALFWVRTRVLLPDTRLARWLFAVFLFLMIMSPLTARILEKLGYEAVARVILFTGYSWMGFIFLAVVGCFFMSLWDMVSWGTNHLTRISMPSLSGKVPPLIMLASVLIFYGYGIFEARHIRIEHLQIPTHKLPPGTNRLRIVQVSDIHLGLMSGYGQLKNITEKIQAESPDILVCTGDLVDGNVNKINGLSDLLAQIHPPYGKYAVTGNHEYYAGIERAIPFMHKAGFTVLRGQIKTINSLINIVGVDDPRSHRSNNHSPREVRLLASLKNNLFTLFLKHRPIVAEKTPGLFDLQLSGHTHGGQIFPFHLVVKRHFPFVSGFYELPKGSALYTSRGTGTWGPRIRILAPPEITVIELTQISVP